MKIHSTYLLYICALFGCVASQFDSQNIEDDDIKTNGKFKRAIMPYPGQALQATSQVLNHPIVAAALQKISMNALATVASALNQVHQEEMKRKSEVEKTLTNMAALDRVAKVMPLLQDGAGGNAGSGEAEGESGSGAESGHSENTQESSEDHENLKTSGEDENDGIEALQNKNFNNNTTQASNQTEEDDTNHDKKHGHHHHHHHHRRHHRHHHHKHNKSKRNETNFNYIGKFGNNSIDWSKLKNNNTLVDKFAQQANIPVTKLLAIFRSGASRSEIAKQTEELLNRTIESQAQLSQLFSSEEDVKNTKDEEEAADEDGQNEEKNKGKESLDKDKKAVAAKNKTVDFDVPKGIPENCKKVVKQYADGELTLKDYLKELKICKKNEEVSAQLAKTTPQQREQVATQNLIQQEAYNYALNTMTTNFRPTVKEQANAVLDKWRTNSFGDKTNTEANKPVPDNVKSFMNIQTPDSVVRPNTDNSAKKTTLTETPKASTNILSENTGNSFTGQSPMVLNNPMNNILNGGLSNSSTDSTTSQVKPVMTNAEKPTFNTISTTNAEFLGKNSANTVENTAQLANTLLAPSYQQQSHEIPSIDMVGSRTNINQAVQESSPKNAEGESANTASLLELLDKVDSSKPLLTGQELAAEQFIASLANPVLQEMPVDTSLVATLKSLADSDNTVETSLKDKILLASLQKRSVEKRSVTKDTVSALSSKRHLKHHKGFLLKQRKRDATDKVKNAKPIERSNMGLPFSNAAPGPKLMDKIRDMSRVIAKP